MCSKVLSMEQTYKPEAILVTRNGQIDDEYYDAIYAEKRRQALAVVGRDVLQHVLQVPGLVGRGAVWLVTHETLLTE